MRILAITALYPPHHLGGYDIRCSEVINELKARGHLVRILTSTYGLRRPHADDGEVWRYLHLEPSHNLRERIYWDIQDLKFIQNQIQEFQPDVIHLFHTAQLARSMFPFLAKQTTPLVYDEGGIGLMLAWSNHGGWIGFCERQSQSILKNSLKFLFCKGISILSGGILPIRWDWPGQLSVYYNSEYTLERHRQASVPVGNAQVIYSGLDLSKFTFYGRQKISSKIRIMMPGRIHPEKGITTAIESIKLLIQKFPQKEIHLDIIGPIQSWEYKIMLDNQIAHLKLSSQVHFVNMLPHDRIVSTYHSADFCLLLTQIPESFSRVPLEAMACGTILITTGTGGVAEIVKDRQNGFIVPLNSPHKIADIIEEIVHKPELYYSVINCARQEMEKNFTFGRAIDQIECVLKSSIMD